MSCFLCLVGDPAEPGSALVTARQKQYQHELRVDYFRVTGPNRSMTVQDVPSISETKMLDNPCRLQTFFFLKNYVIFILSQFSSICANMSK